MSGRFSTHCSMIIGYFLLAFFIVSNVFFSKVQALTSSAEQIKNGVILDVQALDNKVIAVGEMGHIILSENSGENWRSVSSPTDKTITAVYILDKDRAWAVGHDGIIIATDNGGNDWSVQYSHSQYFQQSSEEEMGYGPLMDIWFYDKNKGMAIGSFGQMLVTHDGGESWIDGSESLDNFEQYHLNAIVPAGKKTLIIAGEAGRSYISRDHGNTWKILSVSGEASMFGAWYNEINNSIYIYGLKGKLYRSSDGGRTWSELESCSESTFYSAFSGTDQYFYMVGSDGLVAQFNSYSGEVLHAQVGSRGIITSGTLLDDNLLLSGEFGLMNLEIDTLIMNAPNKCFSREIRNE